MILERCSLFRNLETLSQCCIFVVSYICVLETSSPPAECKTKTTNGQCCSLPFTYKKVQYDSCTKADHNKLWCSLDTSYKGRWGNCGEYKNDVVIKSNQLGK